MNTGIIGGVVTSVQTRGGTEAVQQDVANQARRVAADRQAEKSAGIGETGAEEQASERDADGRRLWEQNQAAKRNSDSSEPSPTAAPPAGKDPTGDRGGRLDLTG